MSQDGFAKAQARMLERFDLDWEPRFVDIPTIGGRAHVIVTGDGPPLMMVIGGGVPAAMWAPLMARLDGFTRYAVDMPGHGLTDRATFTTSQLRRLGAGFLGDVLDGLGLEQPLFVSQSMGGLFTTWLALTRPERVRSISFIGCPALLLGTSAPFLLRLGSIPPIGRMLSRLMPPSLRQVDKVAKMAGEDFSSLPEMRHLLLELERLPRFGSDLIELHHALLRLRGPRPELEQTPDQLARITRPVQLVWGKGDPFGAPDAGRRAAEIIPDAEFHPVPGGHAPWLSHAGQVAAVVAPFLERQSQAQNVEGGTQ
jgi:pimeloyl-ACP methyl ester carboxylesterase